MILQNLEYWVLAQVGLEVILILLLLFFLTKIRSMSKLIHSSQEEEKAVGGHLERFAGQLAALETKRVALEESLSLVTEKVSSETSKNPSIRKTVSGFQGVSLPKPGGSSLRFQVEKLHSQGFSSAEIAHHLGLHPTEVKMVLELSRFKAEQA